MPYGRVEKGHSLNIAHSNIERRRWVKMDAGSYFSWVVIALVALIFTALVLGFMYLVYGKEEETEEEED